MSYYHFTITAILNNNINIKMFFEDKQLPFLIQTSLSSI